VREILLREENPSTADTYYNTFLVFKKKDDYYISLLNYLHAFKVYKKLYGSDRSKTIDAQNQVDQYSRLVHGWTYIFVACSCL